MHIQAALKRACMLARKGERIAIFSSSHGLPARVCVVRDGIQIALLVDDEILGNVAVIASDLAPHLKGSGLHFTIGGLTYMGIFQGEAAVGYVKTTEPGNPLNWLVPFPMEVIEPLVSQDITPLMAVAHATQEDPLRPEFNQIHVMASGVYAGDESFIARVPKDLTKVFYGHVSLPVELLYKFPSTEAKVWWSSTMVYMQMGDELRACTIKPNHFYSHQLAWTNHLASLCSPPPNQVSLPIPQLLSMFKQAKKIADRRLVAIGTAEGQLWMRVGEIMGHWPLTPVGEHPTWYTVLDGNKFFAALYNTFGDTSMRFLPNPEAPIILTSGKFNLYQALWPLLEIPEKGS